MRSWFPTNGNVIDVKPLQPEKAEAAIFVTELGMTIDDKALQPLNEQLILVTELGIITEVKALHSLNA